MDSNSIKKSLKELKDQAKFVAGNYGGGVGYHIISMLWCLLRYGARPTDYVRFQFYKLKHRERNRYVTVYRHQKMMKVMSKVAGNGKYQLVNNKKDEYAAYGDFIHRDWIIVKAEDDDMKLTGFVKGHEMTIAKPTDSDFGRGVMKIERNNDEALSTLLKERIGRTFILEECLDNCYELKQINPSSLNTIRAFTHVNAIGDAEIFEVQLRVGTPGMIVDNWGAGGVVYHVDVATGVIDRAGIDKHNNPFLYHTGSNVKMVGFEIPRFNELKEYVLSLAKVFPKAKVVGWDIAITDKGIDFIEMNCPGGHDIMQAFGIPYYNKYKE